MKLKPDCTRNPLKFHARSLFSNFSRFAGEIRWTSRPGPPVIGAFCISFGYTYWAFPLRRLYGCRPRPLSRRRISSGHCAITARFSIVSRRFQAAIATYGLMMASALLVHLSGGRIELHFHFSS